MAESKLKIDVRRSKILEQLKLDGKVWTVRSADDRVLPEGTLVTVVKLEGVKLYVMPVHTTAGV